MGDFETPLTNKLPIKEDDSCLKGKSPEKFESLSISDYDCECTEMFIKNETNIRLFKKQNSWFKAARLVAIKWILRTREFYGLRFSTAYISLVYFDRLFSKKTIKRDGDLRAIGITSTACLSLAAKMEEGKKAPRFSKYDLAGCRLAKGTVQNTELLVFSTLDWKLKCVTPFDYIHYFVIKFYGKIGINEEKIKQAMELVLAVMGEINAAEQRPSIIAAAAVLAAYDHHMTETRLEDIVLNAVPSWGSIETEQTFSYYKLMLDERFESLSISDYDHQCVEMFIKNETDFQFQVGKNEKVWFKSARLDAIKWILDSRAFYGLHFATAYISLIYLDRMFSRKTIDDGNLWGVGTISIACLSLAAKIEEGRKAPPLSKYHVAGLNLEKNTIEMMELFVLNTLEWNINCVTPFDYIHYFVNKFFFGMFTSEDGISRREEEIISRSVEVILAVMGEINAAERRPSIVAAAAVLAVYNHRLTKTAFLMKMSVVPLLEKEHTFSCYKLMQDIVQAIR